MTDEDINFPELHMMDLERHEAFICPHCKAYSQQTWFHKTNASLLANDSAHSRKLHLPALFFSECFACKISAFWFDGRLVYPKYSLAPLPSPDLPDHIKKYYSEARTICNDSPKAASALLRLCLQQLCIFFGEPGKHLDTDIGNLVKRGLPEPLQQKFDIVRIVGNNSAHPGEIDVEDDPDLVLLLFDSINLIAEQMITVPDKFSRTFQSLPAGAREAIKRRDGK